MDFFGFDILSHMPCCQPIFVLFFSNGLELGDTVTKEGAKSIWDEHATSIFKSKEDDQEEKEKG